MIRSANEVSGLVAKAARGAGLPLGVAEDLAAAIPSHLGGRVASGLRALEGHLGDPATLMAHVAALDLAEVGGAPWPVTDDPCLRALSASRRGEPVGRGPDDVPDPIWQSLEAWAVRTYVPASDGSRRSGAGAGLTDND